ncbi:MAG: iron-sulfur cluster loop [Candidatus Delongbacteria bacterium]|nr:iron-sulfur cluster loop [Candidatus Delongbacteria bacterium]
MTESILVRIAKERFEEVDSQTVHFTEIEEIDNYLNDLENYPHAFVLACMMDRQIKAEKAWKIPFVVSDKFGAKDIIDLSKIDLNEYVKLFESEKLHRFNKQMAEIFYEAVLRICNVYKNDASKIWSDKPSSASVVYRFLEFKGSGIKISTMAANILARQFKIPFSDYYSIDISPDVHIKRVMKRFGYVPENADNDKIIYKARELNPEFPGIIDFSCWRIGRNWCRPNNSDCKNCIVRSECKWVKSKNNE